MKIMNRKSLLSYFGIGSAAGGIALLLFSFWIAPSYLYPNPAYKAYAELRGQAEDWFEKNGNGLAQANIERALAGLPQEVRLNGEPGAIAAGLAKIRGGAEGDFSTQVNLLTRQGDDNLFYALERRHSCHNGRCQFSSPLEFLNSPRQTASLLAGDAKALTPNLPVNYPAAFAAVFDGAKAPSKTLDKPIWLGKAKWLVFSVVCGFVFLLSGLAFANSDPESASHPTRSLPDYAIGWIIIAAFLPGYLAIQALYWIGILANASLAPVYAATKAKLFKPRPFEDEYSDVVRQLEALQAKAAAAGSQESLRLIREALGRVQANRNRAELAQIARSVENLADTIDGIAELSPA